MGFFYWLEDLVRGFYGRVWWVGNLGMMSCVVGLIGCGVCVIWFSVRCVIWFGVFWMWVRVSVLFILWEKGLGGILSDDVWLWGCCDWWWYLWCECCVLISFSPEVLRVARDEGEFELGFVFECWEVCVGLEARSLWFEFLLCNITKIPGDASFDDECLVFYEVLDEVMVSEFVICGVCMFEIFVIGELFVVCEWIGRDIEWWCLIMRLLWLVVVFMVWVLCRR